MKKETFKRLADLAYNYVKSDYDDKKGDDFFTYCEKLTDGLSYRAYSLFVDIMVYFVHTSYVSQKDIEVALIALGITLNDD